MIPLLIINYNKHNCLLRAIESYKKLGDVDIIIIDNGSDYAPLLDYYNECPYKVRYFSKINNPDELPINVNTVLNEIQYPYKWYIVTDSDIEIENPEKTIVSFMWIHMKYNVEMVAPMLRIDDLPRNRYTDEQIELQVKQFWNQPRVLLQMPGYAQEAIQSIVDTTFAMYKGNYRFKRFSKGFRLFDPFMAKHLDWYDDVENLSDEKLHFLRTASVVSTAKGHILNHYPELNKDV